MHGSGQGGGTETQKRRRHAQTAQQGCQPALIEPNAVGIDIGATEIFVAVPADRDPEPVRCIPTFTVDLERLADWLQQCNIRTVAMEINRRVLDSGVPNSGEAQVRDYSYLSATRGSTEQARRAGNQAANAADATNTANGNANRRGS